MTADIGILARLAYEAGVSPLDYAEGVAITAMQARDVTVAVLVAGGCDPRALSDPSLSDEALVRRILAGLLDAGWHMPTWPPPEPDAEDEPAPMPVGPVRVVPRLVIDRDEKGFACLEADCPGCGTTALIVNEWDAAECLSCTWREFEPPQEAS